jgi:RimJ/RimL family protein N-acetyltransferase
LRSRPEEKQLLILLFGDAMTVMRQEKIETALFLDSPVV